MVQREIPLCVCLCVVQFSNMLNQKGWDLLSLVQKCIRKEPGGDPPGKLFDAISVSVVPNSSCVWFAGRGMRKELVAGGECV